MIDQALNIPLDRATAFVLAEVDVTSIQPPEPSLCYGHVLPKEPYAFYRKVDKYGIS